VRGIQFHWNLMRDFIIVISAADLSPVISIIN
jgi:hypothetical protein